MVEIPEHLLERSRQRRSALTGEGGGSAAPAESGSSTPAATGGSSSAPVAAASTAPAVPQPEPEPEPTPPWVEAALTRKKVPWWAASALTILPLFFIVYAWTLGEPSQGEGPLALGAETYAVSCAGCHGGGGGGGAGPALNGGAVVETFPSPAAQVAWVALGSAGFQDAGRSTYGATDKPIVGGMPGQLDSLDPTEIMDVVLAERTEFGQEEFDISVWEDGFEDTLNELVPDQTEEFMAVLDEWNTTPPTG
ncbi:MAG: c-type cytochrome [Microthrixaceae bacterium]|nr:c-type cytochrome [Microthrixaceae bacterium]MCO5320727.1 c-type cytochrome [Microthrixaceae bacterium]